MVSTMCNICEADNSDIETGSDNIDNNSKMMTSITGVPIRDAIATGDCADWKR